MSARPLPRAARLFVSAMTVLPVLLILIALYVSHLAKKKDEPAAPSEKAGSPR